MKSMYPIQIGMFFGVFKENLPSNLPPTPAKMQKSNVISKIPKKPPTPYEINVPNLDLIFLDVSGENC